MPHLHGENSAARICQYLAEVAFVEPPGFVVLHAINYLHDADNSTSIQFLSAVTWNRPARVESNRPAPEVKFRIVFPRNSRNALLCSFLERQCSLGS